MLICGPFPSPSPHPLSQYSFSPLGASWERWAQTAGLVKDPSWDRDNVFARRLPCSALASASPIRSPNSTRNGYLFLSCFFPSLCWAVFVSRPSNSAQERVTSRSRQCSSRQCLGLRVDWQQHGRATGLFKYALCSVPLTRPHGWQQLGAAVTSPFKQCKPISGFVWEAEPFLNFFSQSSISSVLGSLAALEQHTPYQLCTCSWCEGTLAASPACHREWQEKWRGGGGVFRSPAAGFTPAQSHTLPSQAIAFLLTLLACSDTLQTLKLVLTFPPGDWLYRKDQIHWGSVSYDTWLVSSSLCEALKQSNKQKTHHIHLKRQVWPTPTLLFSLHLNFHNYLNGASWHLNINSFHLCTWNNYMFCVIVKRGENEPEFPLADTHTHTRTLVHGAEAGPQQI